MPSAGLVPVRRARRLCLFIALHMAVTSCHMYPANIYGCGLVCVVCINARRLRMWFALRDERVYGVELAGPLKEWTTNPHCLPLLVHPRQVSSPLGTRVNYLAGCST